jgi:hypothetical protein
MLDVRSTETEEKNRQDAKSAKGRKWSLTTKTPRHKARDAMGDAIRHPELVEGSLPRDFSTSLRCARNDGAPVKSQKPK